MPKPGEFFLVKSKEETNTTGFSAKDQQLFKGDTFGRSVKSGKKSEVANSEFQEEDEFIKHDESNIEEEFDVEKDQGILTKDLSSILHKQKVSCLSPSIDLVYDVRKRFSATQQGKLPPRGVTAVKQPHPLQAYHPSTTRPISSGIKLKKLEKAMTGKNTGDGSAVTQHFWKTMTKRESSVDIVKRSTFLVKTGKKYQGGVSGHRAVNLKEVEAAEKEEKKRKELEGKKEGPGPNFTTENKQSMVQSSYANYQSSTTLNPETMRVLQGYTRPMAKGDLKVPDADEIQANILSLDFFIYEDMDLPPQEMMEKYKGYGSEKVFGFSKYFTPQGTYQWKECEVIGWDKEEEKFEIRWKETLKIKMVTRANLRFAEENARNFEEKLELAEEWRSKCQLFFKYHYMINKMDSPTSEIDQELQDRLVRKMVCNPRVLSKPRDPEEFSQRSREGIYVRPINWIHYYKNMNSKVQNVSTEEVEEYFSKRDFSVVLLGSLMKEVREEFKKATHQFDFELALPYSEELEKIFSCVLPQEAFIPLLERKKLKPAKYPFHVRIFKSTDEFLQKFKTASKILHVANSVKLGVLQRQKVALLELEERHFYNMKYRGVKKPEDFLNNHDFSSQDAIRDIKIKTYDADVGISSVVDVELNNMNKRNQQLAELIVIAAERKLVEEHELPPLVVNELRAFQSLVNMQFERAIHDAFIKSTKCFINLFYGILSKWFKVLGIKYNRDKNGELVEGSKPEDGKKAEAVLNGEEKLRFETILEFQMRTQYEETKYYPGPMIAFTLTATSHKIRYDPSFTVFCDKIHHLVENNIKRLKDEACLSAREIGPARKDKKLCVFYDWHDYKDKLLEESKAVINMVLSIPKKYLSKMRSFEFILPLTEENYSKKMKNLSFNEVRSTLLKLKEAEKNIQSWFIQDSLQLGLVLVNLEVFKADMAERVKVAMNLFTKLLIKKVEKENLKLGEERDSMIAYLKEKPKTLEELENMRVFCKKIGENLTGINDKIRGIMSKVKLLEDIQYKLAYNQSSTSWASYGYPQRIRRRAQKTLRALEDREKSLSDELRVQQTKLDEQIITANSTLDSLMKEDTLVNTEKVNDDFIDLFQKIKEAQENSLVVNRREEILRQTRLTDYSSIETMQRACKPFLRFWSLAYAAKATYPMIMESALSKLDRAEFTEEIVNSWAELNKLERVDFKGVPHMIQLVREVRRQYDALKVYLPIINDLRNPGLKLRHWKDILKKSGLKFDPNDANLSFKSLLDKGIMNFKDEIRDISAIASKEMGFEKILNGIRRDWKGIKFELMMHSTVEVYLLKNLDPIIDKLDEDIGKLNNIASSPFVKFLESEIVANRSNLTRIQETIEVWVKVQKHWQYLQPIFYSEDIMMQMPKEAPRYHNADKTWKSIMLGTNANPIVGEACNQPRLQEILEGLFDTLESIIKSLNDYLNKKRSSFARFYFLSNEELLTILAQTRDVRMIQRFLNKLFEGIDYLTFTQESERDKPVVTHMNSKMDERLKLSKTVHPISEDGVVRNIEDWLTEVEASMKVTLKDYYALTYNDMFNTKMEEWLFMWPAQLVTVACQNIWTMKSEEAIQLTSKDGNALKNAFQEQKKKLLSIVDLVSKNHSRKDMVTLGVLIVLEMHSVDVLNEIHKAGVRSINDFEWLTQMRQYYESKNIQIRMVNSERVYGWEYLGNQSRLVITPLTDRCYQTLMSALQMNLGGAPEGPAGTGKTETTKDLSKALAKHCVVFNCSEELDYREMGKFFKGLCSCGSWACFDEFNRIELEVLSVVAQQILTIQMGVITTSNSRSKSIDFEGVNIPLDPTCAVFITMNPGYQGRSELPDNLKALFRPFAMMIPNYAMIAENSLYSYGYKKAKKLSQKITGSLRLASEQLSSQSHYDFGMRAVKTIILATGDLKRAYPDGDENRLILQAISSCNLPKFTSKDIPLFQLILKDLFPNVDLPEPNYGFLDVGIQQAAEKSRLSLSGLFKQKIIELNETINVRHGLMIVGSALSGKSSVLYTLQKALEFESYSKHYIETFQNKWMEENPIPVEPISVQMRSRKWKDQEKRFDGIKLEEPSDPKGILGNDLEDNSPIEAVSPGMMGISNEGSPNSILGHQDTGIIQQEPNEDEESSTSSILDKREKDYQKEMSEYKIKMEEYETRKAEAFAENLEQVKQSPPEVPTTREQREKFQNVNIHSINPKSISIYKLFGEKDKVSGDWHEGVAAKIFRECSDDQTTNRQWIVFDGPVDALWIENMNTVLDDNKKLCLPNSDQIKLTEYMRIMFEVEDLEHASLATVSRCGMVFLESMTLDKMALYQNWVKDLPETLLGEEYEEHYAGMFQHIFLKLFTKIQTHEFKLVFQIEENAIIMSFLKLFQAFLLRGKTKEEIKETLRMEEEKAAAKQAAALLAGKAEEIVKETRMYGPKEKSEVLAMCLMACVWSLGVLLDPSYHIVFNGELRKLMLNFVVEHQKEMTSESKPPEDGNFYDYYYDLEKKYWATWSDGKAPKYSPELQFHEIFVPTDDSSRNLFLLKFLTLNRFPSLFVGKTGTRKTQVIKKYMLNDSDSTKYIPIVTVFSANTKWFNFLDVLESKLEKQKRGRGIYGPVIGMQCQIFVDDLNMPTKQSYGAQPPLELMRQWLDKGGWYDMKSLEFKHVVDIQFLGAMGVGRPPIPSRLLRHFSIIYQVDPSESTLKFIMKTILDWGLQDFPDKVKKLSFSLANLAFNIYKEALKRFLPLPAKSHYLFNLRDALKLVQGIIWVPPSLYNDNDSKTIATRIVMHEATAIFCDRLVGQEDEEKFRSLMSHAVSEEFKIHINDILPKDIPLLFGNYSEAMHGEGRPYTQISDYGKLQNILNDYLQEYNAQNRTQMEILLFEEAVINLSKINRIIAQNFGNGLLIGLGGSGRKTLTGLAAYMQDCQLFEFEVDHEVNMNEWYEFLRVLLKNAGRDNKPTVFMISENQIIDERFLEDLNNLLNIGEIPNLFVGDEKENLFAELKDEADKEKKIMSNMALWERFVSRCQLNLHIVLCLSPIGDSLRLRIRAFPSLVNCSGVIWFKAWKDDSLRAIASEFLSHDQALEIYSEKIPAMGECFVHMHQKVLFSAQMYRLEKKYYYVTPINYTILLKNFQSLLGSKQKELVERRDKYKLGVSKLLEVNQVVETMKAHLEQLKPKLVVQNKETEEAMKKVTREKEEAIVKAVEVDGDKVKMKAYADRCSEIQMKCTDRLAAAEPDLEEAEKKLKELKASDFIELANYKKPIAFVTSTMEAVLKLLGIMPKPSCKDVNKWFWETAKKKLMSGEKFRTELIAYKAESIKETSMQAFEKFREDHPEYIIENAKKTTMAVILLCGWSLSLQKYYNVYMSILPLREDLQKANEEKNLANKELNEKIALLNEINERVTGLEEEFQAKNEEKITLTNQIKKCEESLDRAMKLTKNLSSEKVRWADASVKLDEEIESVLGDIMLSVGTVSYLGAFNEKYRTRILQSEWAPKLRENDIPVSNNFSLEKLVGNPVEINNWNSKGLPYDRVSIENVLIMKNSDLVPLVVDPQKQFTKFIKNFEKDLADEKKSMMYVAKPSKELSKLLEFTIRMGETLIVEGVGEKLDPSIEQFLSKGTFYQGGKKCVTIGGNTIEYHNNFKLYLISSMGNPHYMPEVLTKVTLLNCTITPVSLKEQMLTVVCKKEEPKDEEEKIRINNDSLANKKKLKELEESILKQLSESKDNFLEDEQLVNSLTNAKATSEDFELRMNQSKHAETKIMNNRKNYEPVAELAANLFLIVMELPQLDCMYQFSLRWFEDVFKAAIDEAEKPPTKNIALRTMNIDNSLKKKLFQELSRSLFVRHKSLLALMIAITNGKTKGKISEQEWTFFVNGTVREERMVTQESDQAEEVPEAQKLRIEKVMQKAKAEWLAVKELSLLPCFESLKEDFLSNFESILEYVSNMENKEDIVPAYQNHTPFQKMLFTKALRPDLLPKFVPKYIAQEIGEYFNESLLSGLGESHQLSSLNVPLIFLLSPGDDPQEDLKKLASEKGRILCPISLGKGQGAKALAKIKECLILGVWVLLQNCHLATSWLPELEAFLETLTKEANDKRYHPEFRLWLTSSSNPMFPKSILEDGIKITKDPPKGLKANVLQLYLNQSSTKQEKEFFNSVSEDKTDEWRSLYMALAFFHAVIRERRRLGPVGWNNYYEFNESDFKISVKQLHFMVTKYKEVPYKALHYLTSECYYGGRVTDEWDRRLIKTLLKDFYTEKSVTTLNQFSEVPDYYIGDDMDLDNAKEFISQRPETQSPLLFGLHPNSAIIAAKHEAGELISSAIGLSSGLSSGVDPNRQSQVSKIASDVLANLPGLFDIDAALVKYPLKYSQSMNTVLIQELLRFNSLNQVMRESLKDLKSAIEGASPMTSVLEAMGERIINNQIPENWKAKSYLSLKNFFGYISDFKDRLKMFQDWIDNGIPKAFWVSGFHFTQSFFSGILQTHARKENIPIDKIHFAFNVLPLNFKPVESPENGCYIYGLFSDGMTWNYDEHSLDEEKPKKLYSSFPMIELIPTKNPEEKYPKLPENYDIYECPVYKTTERRGTLRTTGHSTNFVISVFLPSKKEPGVWIKRGGALLSQLND